MSTHGKNWSFPKFGAEDGQMRFAKRPQSRPPSVARSAGRDGSSFTRVGPIQVEPPSLDVNRNTSTLELMRLPLRLSSSTRYRSSLNSPPRLSATTFPYELTRKQLFVSTLRGVCP